MLAVGVWYGVHVARPNGALEAAQAAALNQAIASKSQDLLLANAQLAALDVELATARAELASRVTAADVGAREHKPPWYRRALSEVTIVGSAAAGAGRGAAVGGPARAVVGAALGAAVGTAAR